MQLSPACILSGHASTHSSQDDSGAGPAAPGAAVGAPPWLALAPAALVEAAFSFFHLPCTVRTFVSIFSGHPIASGQPPPAAHPGFFAFSQSIASDSLMIFPCPLRACTRSHSSSSGLNTSGNLSSSFRPSLVNPGTVPFFLCAIRSATPAIISPIDGVSYLFGKRRNISACIW